MKRRTFKAYYEYIELLKEGKKITEEEFRFTIEDLYKRIVQKLRVIAKLLEKENISINELVEVCFNKGELSQEETGFLKEFASKREEASITKELILKVANLHQRLIHVVKWIGYE